MNLKEGEACASGDPRGGGCAWRGVVLLIALVNSVRVTLMCLEREAESHHSDDDGKRERESERSARHHGSIGCYERWCHCGSW
jgi:hypothetical protein